MKKNKLSISGSFTQHRHNGMYIFKGLEFSKLKIRGSIKTRLAITAKRNSEYFIEVISQTFMSGQAILIAKLNPVEKKVWFGFIAGENFYLEPTASRLTSLSLHLSILPANHN
jgi:hypothetical protein